MVCYRTGLETGELELEVGKVNEHQLPDSMAGGQWCPWREGPGCW